MVKIEISDVGDPRVKEYASLTDIELRNRLHPELGVVIAESPKVIKVALQAGWQPLSILCEEKHILGDAAGVIALCPDEMPLYTAPREVLERLTGYRLTRGVLSAMRRRADAPLSDVLKDARRICILDGVCDSTNVGAIFRSAAAMGIDAILLTPSACDPLNRRAVRVSMGTVFLIPWARINSVNEVRDFGFKTLAMALRNDSIALDDPRLKAESKLAIIMGTEGDGLSRDVIASTDFVVKIPMAHNVDSLNVAAASAVAFWELCPRR